MSIHDGHRERMKKRFINNGFDSFSRHNIFELLLFYSKPMGDTNPSAHRLLEQFGSLSNVFDAPIESLCKVKGIGENSAVFIKYVGELIKIYNKSLTEDVKILNGDREIKKYVSSFFINNCKDKVCFIFVDGKSKFIGNHILEDKTIIDVNNNKRELLKSVTKYNTMNVVIAYNNHEKETIPTGEELEAIREISDFLKKIDIIVSDFWLFSDEGCVSVEEILKGCGRD